MPRPLFNLAALVSLLPCVAVAVLWVRSYWFTDSIFHADSRDGFHATSLEVVSGRMVLINVHDSRTGVIRCFLPGIWGTFPTVETVDELDRRIEREGGRSVGGFGHLFESDGRERKRLLTAPLWPICFIAAVLPPLWRRHRLLHTFPAGHCQSCGYDLRETPQRCPECGREAVTARKSATG
jgi:hypothetical protein